MKKGLLLLGAAALCASANAQQVGGWVSADNATVASAWAWDGSAFSKDKVARDAGTLLYENDKVSLSTTFNDDCCVSSCNKLGYTYYVVNGVEYKTDGAANNVWNGGVGNSNPTAITDLAAPVVEKGWVLDYYAKADGYLTVLYQASLNKNFYVIEGIPNNGLVVPNGAVAYDCFIETASEPAGLSGTSFSYKLPADKDGYVDLTAADITKYVENGTGCIMWPYRILTGNAEATADSYPNANAIAIFPIYKDLHYYVFATGSKVTGGPSVYTEEYPTQFAYVTEVKGEDGTVTETKVTNIIGQLGEAGVEAIEAAAIDENAPIYNALGVRVDANAKGLLIQNGKKFIRK